jgi:hypothetical protein
VCDNNGNVAACNGTVTVTQRATTLVYGGASAGQYSDPVTLAATLTDTATGTPLPNQQITFIIGAQSASGMTDSSGMATISLTLNQAPGSYTVAASFGAACPYLGSSASSSFTINPEDARVYYTGTLFASTSGASSYSATVTLAATVKDITAATGDPAWDGNAGDIRKAKVAFVNRDTGAILAANVPVGLVSATDSTVGTATANVTITVPASQTSLSMTIGVIITGYYTRNCGADNSVLTVSLPLTSNFITGGGYLALVHSAGLEAGDPGTQNNFGFNVKYNNSGSSLQGGINTIVRRTESDGTVHSYQIKGNSMTSLSVNNSITTTHPYPTATFNGKASIQDITNPAAPVSIDGNATLQLTMTDASLTGASDSVGITVWNKSGGLWFSSNWNGTKTIEQWLGGGNLVVH